MEGYFWYSMLPTLFLGVYIYYSLNNQVNIEDEINE